jgi:hypothetical protein
MEQKDEKCHDKADLFISEFKEKFFRIHATFHPPDLPGEIGGKGSNVKHAASEIFSRYGSHPRKTDVVITVIDCIHTLSP